MMGAKQTEGEGDVQQQCVVGGGHLQVHVPGGGEFKPKEEK